MVSFSEIVVRLLGKLVVSFPSLPAPGLRRIRPDSVRIRWFDNRADLKVRKAGKRRVQPISSDFQPPFSRRVMRCESVPPILSQPLRHVAHDRVAASVVHQSGRLTSFVHCAKNGAQCAGAERSVVGDGQVIGRRRCAW